jgi:hypothetical protein
MTEKHTPSINQIITETDRLILAIRLLKAKPQLTDKDLRQLARLKADLILVCPPIRYNWKDGAPIIDILRDFREYEGGVEYDLIGR